MIRRTFKKSVVIALTAVMMTTSVPGIFQGTAADVFASESIRQMVASVKTKAQTEIPKADMLDITFNGGKVEDRLNGKNELKTYGAPVITQDEQLGKEVAVFDGKDDGFGYLLTSEDWKAMGSHYSFECMVKESNEDVQGKYGSSLLGGSLNRDGGLFYFKSGGPTFLGLKSAHYTRDLTYKCEKEKWLHLVGTYDGKALKFYVNGEKQGEFAATEFAMGAVKTEEYLNIAHQVGGSSVSAACKIASARAYSKTLSPEEVKSLYEQEDKTNIIVPADASFVVAKGDTYTVPTAEVTTATGIVPEISIAVKDPNGNDVMLDENRQFTATDQGAYKILYTANGTTLEKVLRVTGEPSVAAQVKLAVGDQKSLQIQNLDQNAEVTYTSADPGIATINEKGIVQAKKAGNTNIKITVKQAGHTYQLDSKIIVAVRPGIISKKVLTEGDTYQLVPEHLETDAKITYTSTVPEVAKVSTKGAVRAKKVGLAEIRITVEQNGYIYRLNTKITVKTKPVQVVKPTINVTSKTVLANQKFKISVGHRVSGSKVSFKTGNKKIATVSGSGYVTGIRDGKTTIVTTISQCGKAFTYKTTVTVKGYVKFVKVKKTIKRKKSYTFRAKAYGTGQNVKWSVSNRKLAKISKKGKFTAKKKKGKVYVIVKSGKCTKKFLIKIK